MRSICLVIGLLVSSMLFSQGLSEPMRRFADACLNERSAIQLSQPDYDQQFELLYGCLKSYTGLPLEDGEKSLHPSQLFAKEDFRGHVIFSPEFVASYMSEDIPDPYTQSVPYAGSAESKRAMDGEDRIVYYNALLEAESEATFRYRVSQGEQQLLVIAENATPLEVVIELSGGQTALSAEDGVAQRVWQEDAAYAAVKVRVKNPTEQAVSFVIAVY